MTGIEQLLARFGLAAIFIGAGLEGETVVILGGVVAHRGLLSFQDAVLAAFAGTLVADQFLFWAGRRFGQHPRIARWTSKPAFRKALGFIERHPHGFVLSFRFIYGIRIASPLAIGTSAIPAGKFLLLNILSAVVWAFLFTSLGFAFGGALEQLFGRIRSVEHVLLAVATIVMGAIGWMEFVRWRSRAKKSGPG